MLTPFSCQIAGVGVAGQEPQKLVDDRLHVQLLGGDERKPVGQIEAHLVPEDGQRPGARPVGFLRTPSSSARRMRSRYWRMAVNVVRFRRRSSPGRAELLRVYSAAAGASLSRPERSPGERQRADRAERDHRHHRQRRAVDRAGSRSRSRPRPSPSAACRRAPRPCRRSARARRATAPWSSGRPGRDRRRRRRAAPSARRDCRRRQRHREERPAPAPRRSRPR